MNWNACCNPAVCFKPIKSAQNKYLFYEIRSLDKLPLQHTPTMNLPSTLSQYKAYNPGISMLCMNMSYNCEYFS